MKSRISMFVSVAALAALTFFVPSSVYAQQNWKAALGGQSSDMGRQAVAFLPNELWIHEGDSITWTSGSGDIHTVSFFIAGQAFEDFTVGCPGFSPSGASFDGTKCVSAPPLVEGQSFIVSFPKPGNFSLICLVHTHMTGVIHVLAASATLPHDQAFYDAQAAEQRRSLLTDTDKQRDMDDMLSAHLLANKNSVTAGIGEMTVTGAGFESLSVVRFLKGTIEVHKGDTIEWVNLDPALPHTITFGKEPSNPGPPSGNVPLTLDADGVLHATISSQGDNVHSGLIVASPQNQVGVGQSPPGNTRFRITFTEAGTYNYICALHDNLGMIGKVIVRSNW
ncbi:plastocyanin/azurin family copper-binding protein [Tunturibacter empetritectus]|uniref:Plastocyanin/azurin family copper-binding protein n=1 Tax=Tunturiibacter empetritectus TaxID=3069691 RepID=A0AAU7ZAF6_9BACT